MAISTEGFSRNFVTPVTIILFVVSTVTGLMLFFHWQSGLVHSSHEWLSIVFSAIAIWHLARNWRSFLGYFKRAPAVAALLVALVASVGFTFATGRVEGPGGGGNPRAVFMSLSKVPVERIAPAFGLSTDAALARLKEAGIEAAADESLMAIGERNGKRGPELLFLLASNGAGRD